MQETILIAGASSGIGKKLCELYASEGKRVGIIGRRLHLLQEIKNNYPEQVSILQHDISMDDTCSVISNFILDLGGIDKLILSAGVGQLNPNVHLDIEKKIVETNVVGFISVMNAAYHYFINKGHGQIIAITSIAGARGNNTTLAYNASKSFQSVYLESLRLNINKEGKNIIVTELIPGFVATDMAKGDRIFWMASLNKAAMQCKRAIDHKKERAFITRRWKLIYTILKFLPSFAYAAIINSKLKLQKRN
jgi:short-subunit dehydrogenase